MNKTPSSNTCRTLAAAVAILGTSLGIGRAAEPATTPPPAATDKKAPKGEIRQDKHKLPEANQGKIAPGDANQGKFAPGGANQGKFKVEEKPAAPATTPRS